VIRTVILTSIVDTGDLFGYGVAWVACMGVYPGQRQKALAPIVVTLAGIVMADNATQQPKA